MLIKLTTINHSLPIDNIIYNFPDKILLCK